MMRAKPVDKFFIHIVDSEGTHTFEIKKVDSEFVPKEQEGLRYKYVPPKNDNAQEVAAASSNLLSLNRGN